ncbi:MAG: hypothetical protein CSA60_04445 [Neptuniibacter caesariensis]|uniref:Photosynthesis system II assembly factor Ycf48/Hcf136-like domain-containing protein n=1 Tax=Neptuniibacter caesariensis TaxID=207954 RepID=A0A2G6JLI5_NEPCE|nr:MAG: hypothetical protein CSA60_04445 [Neptuniibacter caesariensis]
MRRYSYLIWFFVAFFSSVAPFSLAATDRLDLPAIQQKSPESMLLLSVARAGDRLVAVGEHGVIILSDDGGITWRQAQVPSSSMLTAVHFFDNQTGWSVGHDGLILKTQDGGESWSRLQDGNTLNALRVAAVEQEFSRLRATEDVDPDLLEELEYKLDDANMALEEGASTPLLDVYFLDEIAGFAVGAYGQAYETRDGGASWQYIGHTLPNPDGLHFNAVFKTAKGDIYLLGEAGLVLKSDDGGEDWKVEDIPYDGSLFAAVESDALYLMGLRGHVFRLSDTGLWQAQVLSSNATINDAVVVHGKAVLVGQGGALIKQEGNGFQPMASQGLRSFASVVQHGDKLIVVGESGVKRIEFEGDHE